MTNALPMSFRSKGGARYPPRQPAPTSRLEGPHHDAYSAMKLSLSTTPAALSITSPAGKTVGMSARLSSRRVNKLQTLISGQDNSAALQKQRCIAEQKFVTMFCAISDRATKTATVRCVKRMVELFFQRENLPSISEIESLETKIRAACEAVPFEVAEYKKSFGAGNNPRVRPPVPALSLNAEANSRSMTLPKNITNDWEALTIANAIDFEENKVREKQNLKKKRLANRAELDKLRLSHEEKARQENDALMKDRRADKAAHEEWVLQEEALKVKKQKEHDDLREMYESQIAKRKVIKDAEKARLKEEASLEVARMERQMKNAADGAHRRKIEEKIRYQGMIEESKRSNEVKAIAKGREALDEVKLQAEIKLRLQREEDTKQKALADKARRYDGIGKQYETQGTGKEKAEAEKKILDIISKEAKLKEARDDARLVRDKEKIEEGKVLFHKYNSQLMNERRERETEEARIEAEYSKKMLDANRDAIDAENRKVEKRKNDAVDYKRRLVEQQKEQRMAAQKMETDYAVSATERALNKNLFAKLLSDEELIGKIQTKFTVAPPAARQAQSVSDRGCVAGLMADFQGTAASPNKQRRKGNTKAKSSRRTGRH